MITEGVGVSGFVRALGMVPVVVGLVVVGLAVALGACGSEPAGPTGPGFSVTMEPGGGMSGTPTLAGSPTAGPSRTSSPWASADHTSPHPSHTRTRTRRPCLSGGGDPVLPPCPSPVPSGTPTTTISAAQPTGTPDNSPSTTPSPQEDSSPEVPPSPVPTSAR
ncbi:hypothetical protein [Nonomuraea lactucae]|uniref:hypothetical protein n=1 Tax=Nonomuraea lactucae TaxID=2249762 RepID=UPI000DE529DD|nr:hypothetical protein [Nonomuraea lactucae]